MNSSQQQFAQQWQTYLQQVAANVNQILAETDAGCRQLIASRPNDTQAFNNAVQAIHIKMQNIKTEAMNALA